MKSKLWGIVVVLLILAPLGAKAQTDPSTLILSLQKQILQLLTQIQTLQKEVTELKTETGIQAPIVSPTCPEPCRGVSTVSEAEEIKLPDFTRSLSLGARGDDVRKLQEFLARDREIYPEGLTTGFYGPRTVEAVRRWQRKHNVEAVGTVGPKTIAKFRELGHVPRLGSGQGVVQGLIQQGAPSGMVPPGLLMAPGIQRQVYPTTTPILTGTTTPQMTISTTTTPAIPAVPATPATQQQLPASSSTSANNFTYTRVEPDATSAIISWTTSAPCIGTVLYGLTTPYGNSKKTDNTNLNAHTVSLTDLIPKSIYYFKIICASPNNGTTEATGSFSTPSGIQPATPATPAQPATTTSSDTTAPTISNTQASSITSSSAVITWTTNKPSDSVVAFTTKSSCISNGLIITSGGAEWYDCTKSGAGGSGSGNTNTTNHQVILSTLSPSTHYYYQAIFPGDAFGVGRVVGPAQTLDTLSATVSQPLPDLIIETTPSVTPSSPSTNQPATIGFRIKNWSSAATITNFSPTFAVESTPNSGDISAGTYAEATIQNITRADCPVNLGPYGSCYITFTITYTMPGQKTFWSRVDPQNQIQEVNENNNSIQSTSFSVIAPSSTDTAPPTITLAVGYPNLTTQTQPVYIGFNANEEAKVVYEYGSTISYGSTQNVWDQYWTANGAYLPTLSSGTIYHVRAKATDRAGNIGYSQDYTFTTASPDGPPVITSGPNNTPTSVEPKEAILVEFATNLACLGTIQYGTTPTYPFSNTKADNLGNQTSHYFYLTGLFPNTTYYYQVNCTANSGSVAASGNYTTGNTSNATPPSTTTATTTSASTSSNLAATMSALADILQKIKALLR